MNKNIKLSFSSPNLILLVFLAIGTCLRLYGITFGKPFLYHPDEIKLVAQAGRLLQSKFSDPSVFFAIGVYPPFFTYMLAVLIGFYTIINIVLGRFDSLDAVHIAYEIHPFQFFFLGRIFAVLLGVISIYILYKIVTSLYSKRIALITIMLFAVDFYHVRNSHFCTVDVPAVLFVLCTFYYITRIIREDRLKYYIGASVFMSLSVATKFSTFGIVVPFLYAHLSQRLKKGVKIFNIIDKKFLISVAVAVLVFAVSCPLFIMDFDETYGGIVGTKNFEKAGKIGSGGSLLSYWTGDQSPGFGVFYPNSIPDGYGLLYTLVIIAGFITVLYKHRTSDILLLLFPLITYLQFEMMAYKAMRHILPIVPFFAVFAALFIDISTNIVRNFKVKNILLSSIIVLFVGLASVRSVSYQIDLSKIDPRTKAFYWISDNIAPGAKIAVEAFPPLIKKIGDIEGLPKSVSPNTKGYDIFELGITSRQMSSTEFIHQIKDNQVKYFISDSFTHQMLEWKHSIVKYKHIIDDRKLFYQWVADHSIMIADFKTSNSNIQPTITIYKLNYLADE